MKFVGSKARIAKHILPIVLEGRQGRYVEPFAGGMNSICEVSGNRLANDSNEALIAMWVKLLEGWQPSEFTREEYGDIRRNKESYPLHIVGWVGYNCSYCGKWFGGYAGKTNTATGTVVDYQAEAIRNVAKQVPKLAGCEFSALDYKNLEIYPEDVVYCDPPYEGTTGYGCEFNHQEFWEWCRSLKAKVFVSEYAAPDDFRCVWSREVKSSLSANGKSGGSKKSVEKLFTI